LFLASSDEYGRIYNNYRDRRVGTPKNRTAGSADPLSSAWDFPPQSAAARAANSKVANFPVVKPIAGRGSEKMWKEKILGKTLHGEV
jgi:hypothetical protein